MTQRQKTDHPRPRSLCAVAEAACGGEAFDPLVREFLDAFYVAGQGDRQSFVEAEPPRLTPVKDAYLAAIAEHLSLRFSLEPPQWSGAPERFLDTPFFAGNMEGLKPLLLVESPLAFRRRMIFISHDALSRPRDPDFLSLAQWHWTAPLDINS
jgi:hypothetical protein